MWFYLVEIKELAIATVCLTLVLAIYPFGIDLSGLPTYFLITLFAFVSHELAHKFTAQKFGAEAHFKLWPAGLAFGFLGAFAGIKFLAPGAVIIYPYKFKRWAFRVLRLESSELGLIALAGPLTNLSVAILFSLLKLNLLASISAWFAFFNMLPIPPLDGSKVIRWNWGIWLVSTLISFFLVIL